jgi:hypothetical protein
MGNLRCFFRCRFQDAIRKQGKLVELHPYRHTANPAPAKSVLHRPLQCDPPYPPILNIWLISSPTVSRRSLGIGGGTGEPQFSAPPCGDKTGWGVIVTQSGDKPLVTGLLCIGPNCLPDGSVALIENGYVLP